MALERVGGLCGLAGGLVLALYLLWNVFVLPPFPSAHAFLAYAAASPGLAFFDDWLLALWFLLTMALAVGLHRRIIGIIPEASILLTGLGLVGLLLALARSAFNIGRMEALASAYGRAGAAEAELLAQLLAWTDSGDAARNLALVLVGGWAAGIGGMGLAGRALPGALGWIGIAAGLSVLPLLVGYLLGFAPLTDPAGYLAIPFALWALWASAVGVWLWRDGSPRF